MRVTLCNVWPQSGAWKTRTLHCIAVLSQGGREEAKEEGKDREIKREGHEE